MTATCLGRLLAAIPLGAALGAQVGVLGFNPGPGDSDPVLVALEPDLYVAASTSTGRRLHRFDTATRALVTIVEAGTGLPVGPVNDPVVAGSRVFFTSNNTVWVHDPSLGDVATQLTSVSTSPLFPTAVGDRLFFSGQVLSGGGRELWVSDGTALGTRLVVDAFPAGESLPRNLAAFGNRVIYDCNNGSNGREPWISDGTAAGTHMLRDIHASGSSDPAEFVVSGGHCYFSATDGATNGRELWRTDGTTTVMIDVRPGSTGGDPTSLENLQGVLYFAASGGINTGVELWRTVAGTGCEQVVDLRTGAGLGSNPDGLRAVGNRIYFSAFRSNAEGRELFAYTPTQPVSGTNPLAITVRSGSGDGVHSDPLVTPLWIDGPVVFTADNGATGFEPWTTSGSSASLVTEVAQPGNSNPEQFTPIGNELFFRADDQGANGLEVYFVPLSGTNTALWRPLGAGCALSNGVTPALRLSQPPRLGTSLELLAENGPPNGIVVFGLAARPGVQRFGSCTLRLGSSFGAVQDTAWMLADATGTARWQLLVPADPAFLGQRVVGQALVTEVGGPFLDLGALTNAIDAFLGS